MITIFFTADHWDTVLNDLTKISETVVVHAPDSTESDIAVIYPFVGRLNASLTMLSVAGMFKQIRLGS